MKEDGNEAPQRGDSLNDGSVAGRGVACLGDPAKTFQAGALGRAGREEAKTAGLTCLALSGGGNWDDGHGKGGSKIPQQGP